MKQQETKYCFRQEANSNTHKLYIYDDVTAYGDFDWFTWEYTESETSAEYFRKALAEIPETDTIELHINSNGGSVKEGVAIYNQLKQKKCKEIVAYVDGFAYSIASVILQAADRRIMGLGTSLLIHNMWISIAGNAEDLRKAADDLDVLMQSNRQIYLEKATITEEELIDLMNKESYLTPDQAIEMGFADELATEGSEPEDPAQLQQKILQQMSQMRCEMAAQKSFKEELLELQKGITKNVSQSDTDNSEDQDSTGDPDNTGDPDDTNDPEQKKTEAKNKMAGLLAKAAAATLQTERKQKNEK